MIFGFRIRKLFWECVLEGFFWVVCRWGLVFAFVCIRGAFFFAFFAKCCMFLVFYCVYLLNEWKENEDFWGSYFIWIKIWGNFIFLG